ncbi:MAG: hypothetical protein HYX53_07790 [Chloroflexi bacterium]|nr:hypothetical protein [Chloroflexota bacterium]
MPRSGPTCSTSGKTYEFTSQFFFDDALAKQIYTVAPYSTKGESTLKNASDSIYKQSGGQTLVTLTKTADG